MPVWNVKLKMWYENCEVRVYIFGLLICEVRNVKFCVKHEFNFSKNVLLMWTVDFLCYILFRSQRALNVYSMVQFFTEVWSVWIVRFNYATSHCHWNYLWWTHIAFKTTFILKEPILLQVPNFCQTWIGQGWVELSFCGQKGFRKSSPSGSGVSPQNWAS